MLTPIPCFWSHGERPGIGRRSPHSAWSATVDVCMHEYSTSPPEYWTPRELFLAPSPHQIHFGLPENDNTSIIKRMGIVLGILILLYMCFLESFGLLNNIALDCVVVPLPQRRVPRILSFLPLRRTVWAATGSDATARPGSTGRPGCYCDREECSENLRRIHSLATRAAGHDRIIVSSKQMFY